MGRAIVNLDNQERGMALVTRDTGSAAQPSSVTPDDELSMLKTRIDAARTIQPEGRDLHCLDCFQRGRDAAIRTIEGKK